MRERGRKRMYNCDHFAYATLIIDDVGFRFSLFFSKIAKRKFRRLHAMYYGCFCCVLSIFFTRFLKKGFFFLSKCVILNERVFWRRFFIRRFPIFNTFSILWFFLPLFSKNFFCFLIIVSLCQKKILKYNRNQY